MNPFFLYLILKDAEFPKSFEFPKWFIVFLFICLVFLLFLFGVLVVGIIRFNF
jgi:hypothetical protein